MLIFIIALPINAFALSSSNRDNSISTEVVDEGQEAKPFTNHFLSYTFDNIDGFKRYLKAVNIDMDTTEGSQDTYLYLCDETINLITTDDDSGTNTNARIQQKLTNGKTYYIGVRFYSTSTTGTFTLKIFENTLPDIPIQ